MVQGMHHIRCGFRGSGSTARRKASFDSRHLHWNILSMASVFLQHGGVLPNSQTFFQKALRSCHSSARRKYARPRIETADPVVQPASYCGGRGFQASSGPLSTAGVLRCGRSMDTLGFFTATPCDMLLWKRQGVPVERKNAFACRPRIAPCEPVMTSELSSAMKVLDQARFRLQTIDISTMLAGLLNAHRIIMYSNARFTRNAFTSMQSIGISRGIGSEQPEGLSN